MGIINQAHQELDIKFTGEEYIRIIQTALLRNIAGIEVLRSRKRKSRKNSRRCIFRPTATVRVVASRLKMHQEVCDAVRLCSEYDKGGRDMVTKDDPVSKFANIVITADYFNKRIMGLFESAEIGSGKYR